MPLADFLPLLRPRPARVAVVYENRERAIDAASAAKRDGETEDVHVVGPLERLLGNDPSPSMRGAWAVVVQPRSYAQCRRVVRALRHPWRRRSTDAPSLGGSPAEAGLVVDRS